MQKEQFDITGMTCSACSARIEKSVGKLPGIKEVSVNLLKNSMVASYDESVLDTAGIVQAVEKPDMVRSQKLRHERKATRLPRQQSRKPAQRRQNISR